jgi:hypothetical protein
MMHSFFFASTYDTGAYGACSYETGSTTCSTGSSGGTASTTGSSSSVLTNTGFDILVAVTIACVITFVALLVRFWKRPATV